MTMSETDKRGDELRRLASLASLAIAVALVGVKLTAWLLTGSMVLLSAAMDALVDTAAALLTFAGVRYAGRPPDLQHRFGHGKGEALAAFAQGVVLGGAGIVLALQSAVRLVMPAELTQVAFGVWVVIGSLVVASGLVVMQTMVVRRTGSAAIAADRAHYIADVAVNLSALAALVVTARTGWHRADPAFALAISLYMLWNSYRIGAAAMTQLLDRELPAPDRDRIVAAVTGCPGARGIHDLRTRHAGDRIFVEFHLEVDGHMSVDAGHAIGDMAESRVMALFPTTVEVTAHLEPAGIKDDRLDDRLPDEAA